MENTELICREAEYMLENKATVRQTGAYFGRGKSTIHKDMRDRLPYINKGLAQEVAQLLHFNMEERARRGGMATKGKYKKLKGQVS